MTAPTPPTECDECSSWETHNQDLHRQLAQLRAQRELLAGQLAIDSEWGCDRWVEWAEKHVAALTPKEASGLPGRARDRDTSDATEHE